VTIKTYEVDEVTDSNGNKNYKKTDRKKTVQVPYIATYEATKSVKFPFAYLITISDPLVISLLQRHGIQIVKLTKDQTLKVESFQMTDLKPEIRLNQGHYLHTVNGSWQHTTTKFKAGTYVIRTAQPLANLAAYLLEPQTNDGLLTWNFLDRYLEPQWGKGFNAYPIYKIIDATEIDDTIITLQ
jgi:hypothetical protein